MSARTIASKATLSAVINPRVARPAKDSDVREDYDLILRLVIHLGTVFGGIVTGVILAIVQPDLYVALTVQGMIPGAFLEIGDFFLKLN